MLTIRKECGGEGRYQGQQCRASIAQIPNTNTMYNTKVVLLKCQMPIVVLIYCTKYQSALQNSGVHNSSEDSIAQMPRQSNKVFRYILNNQILKRPLLYLNSKVRQTHGPIGATAMQTAVRASRGCWASATEIELGMSMPRFPLKLKGNLASPTAQEACTIYIYLYIF